MKSKKDPNTVSRFRISVQLRAKLKEKGIESLFPIQAMTFDTILDSSDLVSRARIGRVYLSLQIYLYIYLCIHQLYWFGLNFVLDCKCVNFGLLESNFLKLVRCIFVLPLYMCVYPSIILV